MFKTVEDYKKAMVRWCEHAGADVKLAESGGHTWIDDTTLQIRGPLGARLGGVDPRKIVDDLRERKSKALTLEIESPGGLMTSSYPLINYIADNGIEVTAKAMGLVASMASVLFSMGSTRIVYPASEIVVHQPWTIVPEMVGFYDEIENQYKSLLSSLDAGRKTIGSIYSTRVGEALAKEWMSSNSDITLAPDDAVKIGLATEKKEGGVSRDAKAAEVFWAVEDILSYHSNDVGSISNQ